nr:hypothetical protein [Micromonospora sp. WMMA2032]
MPSLVFGTLVEVPARTERAAFSASRVSLLPRSRRSRRSVRQDLDHPETPSSDGGGQSGSVGAGALDREDQLLGGEAGGPVEQLLIAAPVGGERAGVEAAADVVQGDGDVDVLVGVDADDDSTSTRVGAHA